MIKALLNITTRQRTFSKHLCELRADELRTNSSTAGNSTLAIGGVSSPLDSFVVAESSVLRTNFCAEKPAHRQSAFQDQKQVFSRLFYAANFPIST